MRAPQDPADEYSLHYPENDAQGLMYTLGGLRRTDVERLAQANPHLWQYCQDFAQAFADYPPGQAPTLLSEPLPPPPLHLLMPPEKVDEKAYAKVVDGLLALDNPEPGSPPLSAAQRQQQRRRLEEQVRALQGPRPKDDQSWMYVAPSRGQRLDWFGGF